MSNLAAPHSGYDIISLTGQEKITLKAIDTARRIVDIASDKLASDIVLLETKDICGFADYFVIVSGDSMRQLAAVADEIVTSMKQAGEEPLHREGSAISGWMLLDYGDVVVHIFSSAQREYYQLDKMWEAARPVVRMA